MPLGALGHDRTVIRSGRTGGGNRPGGRPGLLLAPRGQDQRSHRPRNTPRKGRGSRQERSVLQTRPLGRPGPENAGAGRSCDFQALPVRHRITPPEPPPCHGERLFALDPHPSPFQTENPGEGHFRHNSRAMSGSPAPTMVLGREGFLAVLHVNIIYIMC